MAIPPKFVMAFVPACTAKPPICVNDRENVFSCGTIIVGMNAIMTNLGSIALQSGENKECRIYKNINNRANNFATPKITPNSVNSQLLHNDDDN